MKKYFLFILLIVLTSCQDNGGKATYTKGITSNINGYTIISDTITLYEGGPVLPLLRYNDNYYYSAYVKDSLGDYQFTHFGKIDDEGNVDFFEGCKFGAEAGYSDIHIRHDSIVIKSYYDDENSFYLNERSKKCMAIKTVDDVIFEDENYYVTSLDFGEWGSATWFKDKKTGFEYEVAGILNPEVIKFKGAYYLVSPSEINIVENPKLLVNTGKGTYRKFKLVNEAGGFYRREPRGYDKGFKNIFSRERTYEIERDFFIGPAFVSNDSLRFIVNDNNTMYVAKAESKKLMYIAKIRDSIYFSKNQNNYRNRYLTKTIRFGTMKDEFGLLEIKDNSIQLHYFKTAPKNK